MHRIFGAYYSSFDTLFSNNDRLKKVFLLLGSFKVFTLIKLEAYGGVKTKFFLIIFSISKGLLVQTRLNFLSVRYSYVLITKIRAIFTGNI